MMHNVGRHDGDEQCVVCGGWLPIDERANFRLLDTSVYMCVCLDCCLAALGKRGVAELQGRWVKNLYDEGRRSR